ncbi:MAG: class I SAM-dependent methyltransferase [Actinobacteria bacterium]|nr:class I SAM-dependent methyltransferase [Actinomycetota bacterium]
MFTRIYATDHWKGGSGEGSTPDATLPYRRLVELLVTASDVRSVVDIGCGDWQASRLVDWHGVPYLGVDVVPEVIQADNERFGGSGVGFACADVSRARAPRGDLLLCKDVLQHWPIHAIERFVARERWRHRYLLLTNDIESVHSPAERHNAEIPLGHWRTLDLEMSPFAVFADARFEYPVGSEWRKRAVLLVNPWYRWRARRQPRSGLALARAFDA